jgi:hypothetical protein
MEILLRNFKTEKAKFVKMGATLWFERRKEFAESDGEQSTIEHFASLSQSGHEATRASGEWALNILKNLFSNSLLEHHFSVLTMFKSKYRSQLGDDNLRVPLMMIAEESFRDVDSFDDFWGSIYKHLCEKKEPVARLRGKRKKGAKNKGGKKKKQKLAKARASDLTAAT